MAGSFRRLHTRVGQTQPPSRHLCPPFSYAIGQPNGESLIYPGANVKTAGTIRDILKWRIRDKRSHDIPKLDYVSTVSLSPLTAIVLYQGAECARTD